MFDIFVKRKKIVLDCFVYKPFIYNYAKIDHGRKFLPNWWKMTKPEDCPKGLNIKYCRGLIDFYQKGIVIPSWFSLDVTISALPKREYTYDCSDTTGFKLENHNRNQFLGFAKEHGFSFKIGPGWKLKTRKKIYFTWTQPTWDMRNTMFNMSTLPAVINFYNQHHTAINFFMEYRETEQKLEIKPLQPLVILHPLTEDEIQIRHHLISQTEFESIDKGIYQMAARRDFETIESNMDIYDRIKVYKKWIYEREKIIDKAYSDKENKEPYHYLTEKDDGK